MHGLPDLYDRGSTVSYRIDRTARILQRSEWRHPLHHGRHSSFADQPSCSVRASHWRREELNSSLRSVFQAQDHTGSALVRTQREDNPKLGLTQKDLKQEPRGPLRAGFLSLTQGQKREEMNKEQKGFSLIELLIVMAIILIIAAIAIPNLLRARMAANEASAVGSIRTINTSAVTYNSTYGMYPVGLVKLADVTAGTHPSSTSADLLDPVLFYATSAATAQT